MLEKSVKVAMALFAAEAGEDADLKLPSLVTHAPSAVSEIEDLFAADKFPGAHHGNAVQPTLDPKEAAMIRQLSEKRPFDPKELQDLMQQHFDEFAFSLPAMEEPAKQGAIANMNQLFKAVLDSGKTSLDQKCMALEGFCMTKVPGSVDECAQIVKNPEDNFLVREAIIQLGVLSRTDSEQPQMRVRSRKELQSILRSEKAPAAIKELATDALTKEVREE